MSRSKQLMRGLTKYTGRAIERRRRGAGAYGDAKSPCGLKIRKVIDLCNKGYDIRRETCRVPVSELWRYREFSWNARKTAYPHRPNEGSWQSIRAWMKDTKWANDEPLDFSIVARSGVAKVANGNHRLVLAKNMRLKTAPVVFTCRRSGGMYDMLRPDWGVSKSTEEVSLDARRNWKKIHGGYAKLYHAKLRPLRKQIAKLQNDKLYKAHVARVTRAGGSKPCKIPNRRPDYIHNEQGHADWAWKRLLSDHKDAQECLLNAITKERNRGAYTS